MQKSLAVNKTSFDSTSPRRNGTGFIMQNMQNDSDVSFPLTRSTNRDQHPKPGGMFLLLGSNAAKISISPSSLNSKSGLQSP